MFRHTSHEAGQDLVEYALVLPLFFLLVLSIIEFGILYFQYSTVVNAAREGARAGVSVAPTVASSACDQAYASAITGQARTAALRLTSGLDPQRLVVTVTPQNNCHALAVSVRYNTWFVTQMLVQETGKPTLSLQSTATMQLEN